MKDGDAKGKTVNKTPAGAVKASGERMRRQVALGRVLAPLVQPALARQGVLLAQIVPHWRAICPLLADHSCPESVKGDTLTVAVASDGVKQELHYVTPQIVENISRLLGYPAIARVRGMTRPDIQGGRAPGYGTRDYASARAPLTPHVAANKAGDDKAGRLCDSVRDDALRQALAALGARILNDKTKK